MDPVQLFGQAWPVVQALMGKAVTVVYDWTVSAMPADYQPYAPAMMPGLVAVAFGMGLSVLGKMLGSGSKKVPARTKTTKTTTDPDKYAPKLGTPWHCWFWPMFGETWVVPLAPGWWPRWKWLEAEVKVFAWTVNVSYQANWFIHTVLFKIPGLGWRLVLAVVAHIGIVGGTGQGKDAILQWVIEHVHGRSVVTVCLDLSAPSELSMRRAGGLIIKPNGKVRWNLLAGDPRFMAERVSRFWRMGDNDTGSTRGAFRKIAEAYGRAVPSHQRHIGGPAEEGGQGLYAWCETHKFEGQGHWLNRLYDLHLALGTTDGPNGIDVTELIAKKKKFGFFFDTFRMVAATGPLGIAVILDLMRASADVGDLREGETGALPEDVALEFENVKGLRGAYVILNEGGSLEGRTQELDLFLKAARARDCRVWAAVQNPQHFGGVLTANIFQWIMFATGESKVRKWQSETLDGREPPEAFSAGGGGIRPLECFVQAGGRLQKVRIQPPDMRKPRKMPVPPTVNAANCSGEPVRWPGVVVMVDEVGTGRGYGMAHARQPRLREVPIGSRMLKGPDQVRSYVRGKADRERVFGKLQGTWNRRGCHAWGAKSRNRAYGKTSYLGRSGWSPHFLMWAWRLMVDETDLRRFCEAHPQVQAFEWPQAAELVDRGALVEYERRHGLRLSLRPNVWPVEAELIRLLALQAWMRRWDLHLDHRCPGAPNPLCANAGEAGEAIELAHVWLTTREENLELRWLRERGEVREGVPDVLEAQGVA